MKRVLLLLILTLSVSICYVNAEETNPYSFVLTDELKQEIKQSMVIVYADSSKSLIRDYLFMGVPMSEPLVQYALALSKRGFQLVDVYTNGTMLTGTFGGNPNTAILLQPTTIRMQLAANASIVFVNNDDTDLMRRFYDSLRDYLTSLWDEPRAEEELAEGLYAVWRIGDIGIILQQLDDYTLIRYMLMAGEEFLCKDDSSLKRPRVSTQTALLVERTNTTDYYIADSLLSAIALYEDFYRNGWADDTFIVDSLVSVYTQLSNLYYNRGNTYVGTAIDYYETALTYYRQLYGKQNEQFAVRLYNTGLYYGMFGDYVKEEECLREVVYLGPEIYGDSAGFLHPLQSLAIAYTEEMKFGEAEATYQQILDYISLLYGNEDNDAYRNTLIDMSSLTIEMGDYEKGLELLYKGLELAHDTMPNAELYRELCYGNIGNIAYRQGDYENALAWQKKSAEILDKCKEAEPIHKANVYDNIGMCYAQLGLPDSAIVYLLKAYRIYRKEYSEIHPSCAVVFSQLSFCHNMQGDYEGALYDALKSMQIYSYFLDEDHPSLTNSLFQIGSCYSDLHQNHEAEDYFRKSITGLKKNYIQSLGYMSERQRELYWNTTNLINSYEMARFEWSAYQEQPSAIGLAYDNELFAKGLLLTSSDAIRRSVLESGDSTLIRQWEEMTNLRQRINALQSKSPTSTYIAEYEQKAEQLEKDITKSSAAYRENMRQWNITWDSVRAELKPNEVAIEFMAAPLNADSTMYCALLLRDTCSYPILIPLFEQNEVAGLVDVSMPASLGRVYAYSGYGKQLSQIVWKKIMPYIRANEAVYFAPTGVLHQLAIENLPYDATHTMSDVYQMVRVSSTRELALHKPALPHQKAALYGGIFYEADATDLLVASMPYHRSVTAPVSVDSLERSLAQYLPATKTEVEQIRQTLKTKNIDVHIYSAIDGNEESFKALSGQRQNVLHLATHGFFGQDATATIDPMERSGLLLAGANLALSGHPERIPEGVEDGILTAKEISVLDFRNADIVVLSACETAKGDVSGEGVFGLQRAFKMAGAQTILMALWRVDDEATQILMTAFYRYYSKGMTKRQAFRKAQEEVRRHAKTKRVDVPVPTTAVDKYKNKGKVSTVETTKTTYPYESPYYWAGFILLD